MKTKIKRKKLEPTKNPELIHLADLIGEFIEYWGFKAVQGRLWCYLYLANEPLDSAQLAELLEISPALVTQSVQILLQYRVISEVEKGKNGVLRFIANPKVSEAITGVLEGRELELLDRIQLSYRRLDQRKKTHTLPIALNQERMELLGQWVNLAPLFLRTGIQFLKKDEGPFENPESLQSLALLEQ